MRVLIVPSGIPEDYSVQMANAISRKGVEVGIVLKESSYNEIEPFLSQNLSVFKIPREPFGLLRTIHRIIRFKPDIVHFNDGVDNVSILMLIIFLFSKVRIVTTFHDVIIHPGDENLKKIVVRYILRRKSRKIFVHGKVLKEEFVRKYKVSDDFVVSIVMGNHNSSLFEYYSKDSGNVVKDKNTLNILFFGWIAPRKGVDILLEAVLELVEEGYKNLKLIVAGKVGSGFGYNELVDRINKLSGDERLKDIVEMRLRYIPWNEGGQLYKWADVVVLPYTEISQSGVVGIAYHFSKPVIATNLGALPEIVEDKRTGLLIDGSSVHSIKEGIKSSIIFLLNNPQKIEEFGKNAKNFVETEMNWDRIVNTIINSYSELD
ncbi:MAG: glycosyltransferase family 4 protein [Spirochaetia bacterium]|nr:glycosyltransferase family 4 protein [Spirochaetota bacterium]MDW8113138.1 glycosyltransferase family 4 protein [Spirochaetia bacterium]